MRGWFNKLNASSLNDRSLQRCVYFSTNVTPLQLSTEYSVCICASTTSPIYKTSPFSSLGASELSEMNIIPALCRRSPGANERQNLGESSSTLTTRNLIIITEYHPSSVAAGSRCGDQTLLTQRPRETELVIHTAWQTQRGLLRIIFDQNHMTADMRSTWLFFPDTIALASCYRSFSLLAVPLWRSSPSV